MALYLKNRNRRLSSLAKEIKKQQGNSGESATSSDEPRRVSNDAFFARFNKMQASGGKVMLREI